MQCAVYFSYVPFVISGLLPTSITIVCCQTHLQSWIFPSSCLEQLFFVIFKTQLVTILQNAGSSYSSYNLSFSFGTSVDSLSVSLCLSLVVSLTLLVALVVLLVNCVTCCKEREINFKVRPLAAGSKGRMIPLLLNKYNHISLFCYTRSLKTILRMKLTSLHRQRTLLLCSPQLKCTHSQCHLWPCQDPHISSLPLASQVRRRHGTC